MREIFIFALNESRLQANYDLKGCLQCAGLDLGFRATRAVFKTPGRFIFNKNTFQIEIWLLV